MESRMGRKQPRRRADRNIASSGSRPVDYSAQPSDQTVVPQGEDLEALRKFISRAEKKSPRGRRRH